ncbi:Uncharacterised protein [Legionella londiniensis]|nr:Uncharacterised protein [Legionella londiniensis]
MKLHIQYVHPFEIKHSHTDETQTDIVEGNPLSF